jgi:hypothetical protein
MSLRDVSFCGWRVVTGTRNVAFKLAFHSLSQLVCAYMEHVSHISVSRSCFFSGQLWLQTYSPTVHPSNLHALSRLSLHFPSSSN